MYTKPSRTKASSLFKNKHILLSAFTMSIYIKLDSVKFSLIRIDQSRLLHTSLLIVIVIIFK